MGAATYFRAVWLGGRGKDARVTVSGLAVRLLNFGFFNSIAYQKRGRPSLFPKAGVTTERCRGSVDRVFIY